MTKPKKMKRVNINMIKTLSTSLKSSAKKMKFNTEIVGRITLVSDIFAFESMGRLHKL